MLNLHYQSNNQLTTTVEITAVLVKTLTIILNTVNNQVMEANMVVNILKAVVININTKIGNIHNLEDMVATISGVIIINKTIGIKSKFNTAL